jgi:transcription elongation factor GreA
MRFAAANAVAGTRRVPPPAAPRPQDPGMKDQLLKRLQDEIAVLDRELKSELPKEIKRARELGDLRENAEYKAAKERQTFVQARISMLQQRVATIQLMNLDKLPKDKAAFGSTVHVTERGAGDAVFQLVMPEDADPEKGLISTSSPIGRAMSGKEEGDVVVVVTPAGKRVFEITRLLTVHDAQ